MKKTGFQYRYDAVDQIKDLLRNEIIRKQSRRDCLSNKYVFSEKPIGYLLNELVEMAEIPVNFYDIKYLNEFYTRFKQDYPELLFTIEDLFAEGWLIRSIDEWGFGDWRFQYEGVDAQGNQRAEIILTFLRKLSELPYAALK